MPRLDDYIPEGLPEPDVAELTEEGARELGIPIDAPQEWPDAYELKYADFGPDDDAYEHPHEPSGPAAGEPGPPPTPPPPPPPPPASGMTGVLRSMVRRVTKDEAYERLHPRDILGRFTAKPFSAVLGPGGSATDPHDRKTARAVGRQRGRRRLYSPRREAERAQRELDRLKDDNSPNAELQRQYNQGFLEGMADRADRGTADVKPSEARQRRKLPQPKFRRRAIGRYAPGYADGIAAAGAVGEKRRRWMQRKAAEILVSVPEDHPQREYWQGVADYDPEVAAEEKRKEFKRLEVAARERRLAQKREEGKRAFKESAENVTELQQKIKEEIVAAGTDEEAKAYWEGAQEAVNKLFDKREARKRAARMREEGFKKGEAIPNSERELEAANAYRMHELGDRDDVKAMWEGVLRGLGKPLIPLQPREKRTTEYTVGFKLGQLVQERPDDFKIDVSAAKAQLALAEKVGSSTELRHWSGVLDGLLAPPPPSVHIEHLPGAPATDDLPKDGDARALLHRVPGDEELAEGVITEVKHHGGGVNTTKTGMINGKKVIIKPIAGAYSRRLRHAIPAKTDLPRERAGWFAADQLGIKHVARAVARDVPGEGPSTVMEFIPNAHQYIDARANAKREDIRAIWLLDAVIGNTDRHMGNAMVSDDGHVWPIDHGLTFPTQNGEFRWDIRLHNANDNEIALTPQEIGTLRKFDTDAMASEFERIGLEEEAILAMRQRVQAIIALGKIPGTGELRRELGFNF